MIGSVLSVVLPLLILAVIFRIIVGSGGRFTSFNPCRAFTAMNSTTGSNAAAVLAAVSISQSVFDLARRAPKETAPVGGVLIVAVAVAALFALAVARKEAGFFLAIVGVTATLLTTMLDFGIEGGLLMLALSLPIIWIFGLARGLTRTR